MLEVLGPAAWKEKQWCLIFRTVRTQMVGTIRAFLDRTLI
jgi:hypothetical protein